jgi:GntR family transcriptional repressor for pyruvate dehydrogenase complex
VVRYSGLMVRPVVQNLAFEPIARETVSSQIRAQLLARITTGELAPGSRIPSERDLAEQFRVARTSVREALQGLATLGVIERRGNRSYVAQHLPEVEMTGSADGKDFVRELFETREVLEVPIFTLATQRADDDARAAVAASVRRFDPTMEIAEFRRLDRGFHTTVAAACANPLLIELYAKVLDRLFRSQVFDSLLGSETNRNQVQTIVAESFEHHRRIAAAFAVGDADAMIAAARAHLAAVEHRMTDELV